MMAYKCFLPVLLIVPYVIHCTSAAVHSHNIETAERESDGSYRARDFDHYSDAGHNLEFDHEAILGSVKEAEEYDKLSPEESKRRLGLLLPKMDLNGDQFIDRKELKKWILNSFIKLSREESEERMSEADENRDGSVSWAEYLQDTFGVDQEADVGPEDTGDTGLLLHIEKVMWSLADKNGDSDLNVEEFERDICLWLMADPDMQDGLLSPSRVFGKSDERLCLTPQGVLYKAAEELFRMKKVFSNPEEHEIMQPFLVNQTIHERDRNGDGVVDFSEYIGDRGSQHDKEWLLSEKDKFEHELDLNQDGVLDADEVRRWIIPDNDEIAEEEVDHLFASADDDHDDLLSFHEILTHHHVFVGSEATDYGNDLLGERFDDEL